MDIKVSKTYRNKKNGKIYIVLFLAMDVTENKDTKCVVYTEDSCVGEIYVRGINEFKEKFETILENSWLITAGNIN